MVLQVLACFYFYLDFYFALIISGFGKKKIKYTSFIYNRILRIFPLMVFVFFITITVNRQNSTPIDILRLLTLQLNTGHPFTGWGHEFFPIGPIWTIAVEFQFYLLFPFLALFLAKYGIRYLLSVILLMVSVRFMITQIIESTMYYNFYHSLIGRLDQFVIGMIFAVLWNLGAFDLLKQKKYALIISALSIHGLTKLFMHKSEFGWYVSWSFTIEAILWGLIVIAYLNVSIKFSHYIDIILAKLGEISFSLYLLHLPIAAMLEKVFHLPVPVTISDSLALSAFKSLFIILIAFFTFYTIEKPFMALRIKYTSNQD